MLSLVENLFKKNPLQDLLSSLNAVISTNESTQIITGHVIYNPAYTYKFQLKTTLEALMILLCISYVILYNFEDTKLIRGHIASVALIGVWTNLTGEFFYYDRKI